MLIIFVLLTFLYFFSTYFSRRDFLSPTFLLSASFLMTSMIFLWNVDNWELKINWLLIVYVATAMISFSFGSIIVRPSSKYIKAVDNSEVIISRVEGRSFIDLAVISVVCTLVYLFNTFNVIGNENIYSISNLLRAKYEYNISTNESNILINQMMEIPIAIAYVNTFLLFFAHDKRIFLKKAGIYISLIAFFVLVICMTDRNVFLRYVIYTVCLWILFYKNKSNVSKRKQNMFILKRVMIILVIVSICFFFLGRIKAYTSNFERAIGIYGGSGLYNFNLTINNDEQLQWGKETFKTLISTINTIIGKRSNVVSHGTFITYRSSNGYVYSSNIYSSLKSFKSDFGYFGVIIFPMFLGMFFEFLYQFAKRKIYGFSWIFYSMCIYPILYFCIADQFFRRMHIGRIYEVFWIVFFFISVYKIRVVIGNSIS